MRPYSQDLRQRVLHAIDAGDSQSTVAKTLSVSVATIKRYLKQRREMGHVLPKAIPGRASGEGSSVASPSASATRSPSRCDAGRALPPVPRSPPRPRQPGEHQSGSDGAGLDTKKKILRASEQDEAERSAWREQAKQLSTQDLVIVDETGSRINMTPLYAYAPRGKRAIGTVPTPLRGEPDPDCFIVCARHG